MRKQAITTLLLCILFALAGKAQEITTVKITDWNKLQNSGFFSCHGADLSNSPLINNRHWYGINMSYYLNPRDNFFYNGQIAISHDTAIPQLYVRSTNQYGEGKWYKIIHDGGDQRINGKLDVTGVIRTTEINVETGWADFVFDKDYNLPTLAEVENHINTYNRLPDIPSEEEVKENGVNLGNMQAKLLQKIEELTLYVIEQNKQINKLKEENKSIKQQLNINE